MMASHQFTVWRKEVPEVIALSVEANWVGLSRPTTYEVVAYVRHEFELDVVAVWKQPDGAVLYLLGSAEFQRLKEQQKLLDGDGVTLALHLRPHEAGLIRNALSSLALPAARTARLRDALEVAIEQPEPLVAVTGRFR